ncbi:MAG: flagellar basal body rod protein FlgG, partial [Clostridiales bacterium]|nr:flagellar basal body rod protein FlgG [Clostridiales bacterium]
EGFFMTLDPSGNINYTRQGNFYLTEISGDMYLVDSKGHFVLDDDGAPVVLPAGASSLVINSIGDITFTGPDDFSEHGGGIGIRSFTDPDGLSARGYSYYQPTVASGEPETTEKYKIRQGVLEMSNVDMASEMTRLIRTQRAFSLASRALTTADDMEGIANNMRR